jgi:ABC-type lipoprotein release transport system permease subunit
LLVLFAAVGVALTIVGIYGVTYLVARRTRELALRMAVGASPVSILWLIVRQGLSMALVGAVVGLSGAFAARQPISGLLFGISPSRSGNIHRWCGGPATGGRCRQRNTSYPRHAHPTGQSARS